MGVVDTYVCHWTREPCERVCVAHAAEMYDTSCVLLHRRTLQDKPLHENYAKDLEAEKKKAIIHDARRAFVEKGQEKKEEAPVKHKPKLPIPRWGASKVRGARRAV